jgi:hypothetical protein
MSRDPETIQREIEQAREALAETFDALAERASPRRVAERGRAALAEAARSPQAQKVYLAGAVLVTLLVARRIRRARRARRSGGAGAAED